MVRRPLEARLPPLPSCSVPASDHRPTGIAIGIGEAHRAGSEQEQAAVAGDDAAQGRRHAARRDDAGVPGAERDVARRGQGVRDHEDAGGVGIAQSEPAGHGTEIAVGRDAEGAGLRHHRAAGIAVGGIGQRQRTAAGQLQLAGAGPVADPAGLGHGKARRDIERRIAGQRHGMAVGPAAFEEEGRSRFHRHRPAVAQAGIRGDGEAAPAHGGAAAVGVGAEEKQRADAGLHQAAGAVDRADEGALQGADLVDRQRAVAELDRAGGTVEPADRLVVAVDIEGDAGAAQDDHAGRGQAAAGAEPKGALRDRRPAGIAVGTRQGQRAGAEFAHAAAAGDLAAIGAVGDLIEGQAEGGIVGDVALEGRGVAHQAPALIVVPPL